MAESLGEFLLWFGLPLVGVAVVVGGFLVAAVRLFSALVAFVEANVK